MTTTPTTSTSSHFSNVFSRQRVAASLDRHAHLAHPGDVPELGHRQAHPGGLEVAGDDPADVLRQRLQQLEAAVGQLGADALHHLAVVDRVVDVVAPADLVAGD